MSSASQRAPLSRDRLRQQLRKAGLRVTLARLEVLAALTRLGGHHSADEVAAELKRRGVELPRASIYNAIRNFLQAGLAQQADIGPGRAVYEIAARWHHHFVCRNCGSVTDVACLKGQKPCLEPSLQGFEVDEAQIIFRGLCPDCASS